MVMIFLPYGADFKATAQCLDRARLGKQRLESRMIMQTLTGKSRSWSGHPVMKMWAGNLNWLYEYNCAIYDEYAKRGYNDHTRASFDDLYEEVADNTKHISQEEPYWLNSSNTHYTHRGNLHRKKPEHYKDFERFSDYREYVCCPDHACNTFWSGHFERRINETGYMDIFQVAPNKFELEAV